MIIYLHGFGSSAFSTKAQKFSSVFDGKEQFIAPNLPTIPTLAAYNIEQLITLGKQTEEVRLMGSSLGGYYAAYFANKYNLKAVLLNPAVYPYKTLKDFSDGKCHSYFDNSGFEFTEQHVQDLEKYQVERYTNIKNFLVCLQTGDEVLDYTEAETKFAGAECIIDKGGDHAFSDIEKHFSKIKSFLLQ